MIRLLVLLFSIMLIPSVSIAQGPPPPALDQITIDRISTNTNSSLSYIDAHVEVGRNNSSEPDGRKIEVYVSARFENHDGSFYYRTQVKELEWSAPVGSSTNYGAWSWPLASWDNIDYFTLKEWEVTDVFFYALYENTSGGWIIGDVEYYSN